MDESGRIQFRGDRLWFDVLLFGDQLSLDGVVAREQQIRQFGQEHPLAAYAIAFSLFVAGTGLSLPVAAAMTLVIGWYFGFSRGVVLVSFASTTGATLAFLLSRYLLRETIERRFGEWLLAFNEALQREGAFYLFTLRLIPAVPFFVINVVMGLTKMHVRTFWWVSQLGMLAGTCVFVYAGSAVPDLRTLAERGAGGILTPQLSIERKISVGSLSRFGYSLGFTPLHPYRRGQGWRCNFVNMTPRPKSDCGTLHRHFRKRTADALLRSRHHSEVMVGLSISRACWAARPRPSSAESKSWTNCRMTRLPVGFAVQVQGEKKDRIRVG